MTLADIEPSVTYTAAVARDAIATPCWQHALHTSHHAKASESKAAQQIVGEQMKQLQVKPGSNHVKAFCTSGHSAPASYHCIVIMLAKTSQQLKRKEQDVDASMIR